MKRKRGCRLERGFTLIEMLTALGIFLLITGAAFTLLTSSQQRFRTEAEVLSSFQEARLGLDQMVRDINDAGFPPPSFANIDPTKVTSAPFGWQPGYTVPNPCLIGTAGGGSCTTPNDFDLIIETEPNPSDPACPGSVEWIRYQLPPNSTTLMRAVACKLASRDPAVETAQAGFVPFVQNVMNNSPTFQIGQFQLDTAYPAVFQGGAPVALFQYWCDTSVLQSPPQPCPPLAAPDNSPANIRDVAITLIVAAPLPDATTGQPRLVQLEGRARRINPNQ
ncbi:MAG TPA: prepilin-type N-terminal cleavage/methylation domain-containing protein [Terriglobales bacterium]|nr:prepilin-type N-terminal cleavage/methylation domain-containing protein [Terriglobales bacterium]